MQTSDDGNSWRFPVLLILVSKRTEDCKLSWLIFPQRRSSFHLSAYNRRVNTPLKCFVVKRTTWIINMYPKQKKILNKKNSDSSSKIGFSQLISQF